MTADKNERRRQAVDGLASDIVRGTNGKVSSEEAHRQAREIAEKSDRKDQVHGDRRRK